jgi:hypothetical protein
MTDGYWRHVEPIWNAISIYDGPDTFLRQFSRVPEHAGHLFAVHWCISEVCNGGLHQFFSNSTGVLAPEAVAGFRAVGMPETAAIVEQAMARLPSPYPRDREDREDALDALDPEDMDEEDDWESPFDDLDSRFYELYSTENGGWKSIDGYAGQFPVPRRADMLGRLLYFLRR